MEFDPHTKRNGPVGGEGVAPQAPAGDGAEGGERNGDRKRYRNRHRRRGNARPDHRREQAEDKTEAAKPAEEAVTPTEPSAAPESKPPRERRDHRRGRRDRHPREEGAKPAVEETVSASEASVTVDEDALLPAPSEACEPFPPPAPQYPEKPRYVVVGVRFRPNGKVYYFDPGETTYSVDSHVVVETARGDEFAVVSMSNRAVPGTDVVLPLRRVLRLATEEDERCHEENLEKETEAYNLCLSRIEAHRLDMKLVDVEYAFDHSKLLFYFTAEGRVDFRELVKDLASVFRTRIELRQIGIRDEAKLMGGLGVCGRPFCCKSFLPDFVQVSIKMAKEQNLSLNSAKISGACGRLMCCLRYEYDTYLEESALTPKVDAIVDTPDGEGVVVESSPLKGTVKVVLNKEPNAARLYRREDLTVTGSMKARRKQQAAEAAKNAKKTEEKKENPGG